MNEQDARIHDCNLRGAGAPGMFHNVYLQPWAYREFIKSGAFPEGTMFVLSFYEASRKSAPAKAGFYEGDRAPNIDVHLKRTGIDKSGWAFFVFADSRSAGTKLPGEAACYSCHATEAAHDNGFTQFYPPIRERLAKVAPPAGSARPAPDLSSRSRSQPDEAPPVARAPATDSVGGVRSHTGDS